MRIRAMDRGSYSAAARGRCGASAEAEAELELGVVGVVAPEGLGDVIGLVVAAGGDGAGDQRCGRRGQPFFASSSCSIRA